MAPNPESESLGEERVPSQTASAPVDFIDSYLHKNIPGLKQTSESLFTKGKPTEKLETSRR